jgi:hypothetical protein
MAQFWLHNPPVGDKMSVADIVNEVMAPAARGRRPSGARAAYVRDLTPGDIVRLQNLPEGSLQSALPPIKRLRHSHHTLAKLLADGVRQEECSAITGYSPSYISNMQKDPAFAELISYYVEQKKEVYLDVHQKISTLSLDAVEELQSRLAEVPETFQIRDLKEIAEMGLDRTGFGKTSNINHQGAIALVDPVQIARMKDDLRIRATGEIRALPHNPRPQVGETIIDQTMAGASQDEGRESEGAGISEEGQAPSPEDVPGS